MQEVRISFQSSDKLGVLTTPTFQRAILLTNSMLI
jgi:hypothetical protein